jgi:hypothetical protein
MTTNPYAVTSIPDERGVYSDHARLLRRGFLYRQIELQHPVATTFVYDGWWFRQRISFDGITAWLRISWLTILRRAEFQIPAEIDPHQSRGRVEIGFSRGLSIRRFRVWIDDALVYDEVN